MYRRSRIYKKKPDIQKNPDTVSYTHLDVYKRQGQPLTAEKVKAAWEKSFSTTKDWANISLFLPIEGSQARLEGRTPTIAGLEAVDSNTLRIRLEKPNSAFLHMLTNPIFWVYDEAETTDPSPGTGPFILQASTEDHTIVMTRNEKYHQGPPRLSALQFALYAEPYQAFGDFKINKLDYVNQVPLTEIKNIKNDPDYKERLVERYLWETYSLGFNMNRAPYAGNYLLRRALNSVSYTHLDVYKRQTVLRKQ